jgi:hypothetical protein
MFDPSAKPATIDFRNTAGEMKGKTWLRIYEMEGDVLRICDNADDVAKGRPAAFVAGRGFGPRTHRLQAYEALRARPIA